MDSHREEQTTEQTSYGLSESGEKEDEQKNFSYQRSIESMLVFWA